MVKDMYMYMVYIRLINGSSLINVQFVKKSMIVEFLENIRITLLFARFYLDKTI